MLKGLDPLWWFLAGSLTKTLVSSLTDISVSKWLASQQKGMNGRNASRGAQVPESR